MTRRAQILFQLSFIHLMEVFMSRCTLRSFSMTEVINHDRHAREWQARSKGIKGFIKSVVSTSKKCCYRHLCIVHS